VQAREPMNESVRGWLLLAIEPGRFVDRHVWKLAMQLSAIWVLVFALLTVILGFVVSRLNGAMSVETDAARAATLVDGALLILFKILPPK